MSFMKKNGTRKKILRYAELVFKEGQGMLNETEQQEMLKIEKDLDMNRNQLLDAAEKKLYPDG